MTDEGDAGAAPGEAVNIVDRQTWLAFIAVCRGLGPRLDEHHRRRFGISHLEYSTLIVLAESPGSASELSSLARRVNSSLSRMSYAIRRLRDSGYVELTRSTSDGRATTATLTAHGGELLREAAAPNMREARRLVFDPLDDVEREQLREICFALLAAWRPDEPHPWVP